MLMVAVVVIGYVANYLTYLYVCENGTNTIHEVSCALYIAMQCVV